MSTVKYSYVRNVYLHASKADRDEGKIIFGPGGDMHVQLDGYSIIPKEAISAEDLNAVTRGVKIIVDAPSMTDTTREAGARALLLQAGVHENFNTAIGLIPYNVAIRAVLAALRPAQDAEGWRDIASDPPPKDEDLFNVGNYNGKGEWCAEVWCREYLAEQIELRKRITLPPHLNWMPRYWCPLPSPPRTLEGK